MTSLGERCDEIIRLIDEVISEVGSLVPNMLAVRVQPETIENEDVARPSRPRAGCSHAEFVEYAVRLDAWEKSAS